MQIKYVERPFSYVLSLKWRTAMPQQSSLHVYLEWTKQRIDEMDATLASLEIKAGQMTAASRAKAEQLLAELKKRGEEFRAKAKANVNIQTSEAALRATQAQLETQWEGFEAQVKAYFETTGKQIEQQQATFRAVAAAQTKAWRESADQLQAEAMKVAVAKRADIDVAIKQMKAQAAEAEVQFQKLKQAGAESWSSLSAALAQSRKTFSRATRHAWDAVDRAGVPKS
jgi:hypothetical protein